MLDWKRKLALIAVPAALAIGGGSVAAYAVATPTNAPAVTQTQTTQQAAPPQPEATDQPETAPEPVQANEPDVAGGHTDVGDQADHQFDGVE